MARGQTRGGRVVVREAEKALDSFKYEIANELGLGAQVRDGYWGEIPARQCGTVGGQMVRRMIELAERSLAGRGGAAR